MKFKIIISLFFTLILFGNLLNADSAYQQKPQKQKEPDKWSPKMPKAHGCASNEDFVTSIDYLIMRSYNPNLVYAFDKKNIWDTATFQNIFVQGKMRRPDRTWRPGFRVGLGWNTPYDLWDLKSDWTYYYNKSVTNNATDPMVLTSFTNIDVGFVALWANPVTPDGGFLELSIPTYTQLQGISQLNYNMINLELGRSLHLTKALAIRSHFGLQSGWIYQKANITYARSFNIAPGGDGALANQLVRLNHKFRGIGLRGGLDGEWQLGAGFSLIGKAAVSILSGRVNLRKIQFTGTNASTALGESRYSKVYDSKDRIRELAPGLEAALGVLWGMCLNHDTMYFGLSANWESIYWWGQFRFSQPKENPINTGLNYRAAYSENYPDTDGALNLEGVTVRARFDF